MSAFAAPLPAGTNIFIAPLILLIEVVSNLAKFISLGIRLFANMFAGHLLLKVFYCICFEVLRHFALFYAFSGIFVVFFIFFIVVLELLIAFLQAFVFSLLVILYLQEATNSINGH